MYINVVYYNMQNSNRPSIFVDCGQKTSVIKKKRITVNQIPTPIRFPLFCPKFCSGPEKIIHSTLFAAAGTDSFEFTVLVI